MIKHEIVEFIPEELNENTLYISERFSLAIHKCACGCAEQVVTPLGENEWTLTTSGDTVSLHPSIGNRFACKSHYWIKNSEFVWA